LGKVMSLDLDLGPCRHPDAGRHGCQEAVTELSLYGSRNWNPSEMKLQLQF
jgi:hypothetical protein